MRATLHVVSDSGARRRLDVRGGQTARFGRTDWADYSFPADASMADVHFLVEWRGTQLFLRDLGTGSPTTVNGQPAQEIELKTNDRIVAGRTQFVVELELAELVVESAGELDGSPVSGPQGETAATWVELLTRLEVEPEALAVPQDGQTADEVVASLLAAEQYVAAARLRCHQLGNRAAVWWALRSAQMADLGALNPLQQQAIASARDWVAEPNEPQRRQCERFAEATGYEDFGGLLAAAAFFSGGSVAPADVPMEAPPDPRLTGRLVAGVTLLVAVLAPPDEQAGRWTKMFADAAQLLTGPITWPEPNSASAA